MINRTMPDGHKLIIAVYNQTSSASRQFPSVFIHIRTGHPGGTAYHYLIITLQPTTAKIVGHKQIIIIAMLEDKRGLDGIYGTRRYVGSPLELACAYCVQFSGFKVEVKSSVNRTNWMPPQKEPNAIQGSPFSSTTMFGSMALKLSRACDTITAPVSVHGSSDAELKVLR